MKKVEFFYLENCPYCKKAMAYLEELKQDPKYASIEISFIEESKEAEYASLHDYYYVPTFYIDDQLVHEGAATKEDVQVVLEKSL